MGKTITVKIMGKAAQVIEGFEGSTVQDVLTHLGETGNFTFNINGSPATKDSLLSDGAFLVLSPSVKGAARTTKTAKKPVKKVSAKVIRKHARKAK